MTRRSPVAGAAAHNRLAIFLPSLYAGGAERIMLSLAGGFAARELAVDLVLARAEGDLLGSVPERVRVVDLSARRVATSLGGLVRYLRAERPRALLSAPKHANVLAVLAHSLARVDTRLVLAEHTTPSQSVMNESSWYGRRVLPRLMRRLYPRADHIVAVSRGAAEDLTRLTGLPDHRISVIYNPAVTDTVLARSCDPVDHPWLCASEPPVILGVGRLTAAKDFPTLIRAFAALRARRPARLLIFGEGAERPRLEALVAELGLAAEVSLPGFVTNPWSYMSRAAVFVLSSRWEGFGNVVAEALACGARVVSTDCPSGPAEILEGGRWGRLVPVGDVDALADAIEAALDDERAPSPDHLDRFFLERAIDEYVEVLLGSALPHAGEQSMSPASSAVRWRP